LRGEELFVIAYDIPDDRRRVRLSNLLKSFGERVQLSVFECWLTPAELEELVGRITYRVDLSEDSVRIYRSGGEVRVLGVGPVPEEEGFYLG